MKKTSLPTSAPLCSAAINQRAYQLLFALEEQHFKDLAAFAAWQLGVGCRHPGAARELLLKEGADLLDDCFEAILTGLSDPTCGRHPRPMDVNNLHAFLRYMRNVIRSMRYHQAGAAASKGNMVVEVPNLRNYKAFARTPPEEDVELRDLRDEFFAALRRELDDPEQYAAVLETWHANFFRIERLMELGLSAKDAWKLRKKARRLYRQLSEPVREPPLSEPELS
jgi:hypothetical protein